MKYTAHIPFIDDMGSISPIRGCRDSGSETKEQEALWHINSMRDHDNLPHLNELPYGVKFIPEYS